MKKRRVLLAKLYDNKGSLLIISYLVIFVLLALGAAFIAMSVNESRIAERQRRTTMTFHIAEAGIERALYDLRQDFVNDASIPGWADGNINGFAIGPDMVNFYSIGYGSTSLNGGSYAVQLKNVSGISDAVWIRSTGTLGDVQQTIEVYARIIDISPWNNAIFAGAGAAGAMVNGNVDVSGSVHVLGTNLQSSDLAVDLGGTAEIIGNNYSGLSASLKAKVPLLPMTVVNGETVETLNAELRVKRGIVGLSGSATAGEANVPGNAAKETIDAAYVTDGFGGSQGAANVHSDNGTNNAYDLGDAVQFPSLSDPYGGYSTYQEYLQNNALVLGVGMFGADGTITPRKIFSFSNANGSISMDGNGNMTISGIVYIDNSGNSSNLNMAPDGNDKTITYTGSGVIFAEGDAHIDVNLVTSGNSSFPANIIGIMTPHEIEFNAANIDVMGLFYAEGTLTALKQTDIVGTIVANSFDMGTNVPSVYQVPDVMNHLPAGLIGQGSIWVMKTVAWRKI